MTTTFFPRFGSRFHWCAKGFSSCLGAPDVCTKDAADAGKVFLAAYRTHMPRSPSDAGSTFQQRPAKKDGRLDSEGGASEVPFGCCPKRECSSFGAIEIHGNAL